MWRNMISTLSGWLCVVLPCLCFIAMTVSCDISLLPDLSQTVICPTFAPFEFTTWKLGDDSSCDTSSLEDNVKENKPENNSHRFDINAVPEPIDDDAEFFGDDCLGKVLLMGLVLLRYVYWYIQFGQSGGAIL